MIKQYWTKQRIWLLIFLVVVGIGALLFTSHNEQFYQQPIAKVISEKTVSRQRVKDQFANVDYQYNQQLQVKLMNGKYRGQKLTVQNTYSDSQPMDQRYRAGNEVFLTQLRKRGGKLTANVNGYKRDTVIVFLLWLVVLMLLLQIGRAHV